MRIQAASSCNNFRTLYSSGPNRDDAGSGQTANQRPRQRDTSRFLPTLALALGMKPIEYEVGGGGATTIAERAIEATGESASVIDSIVQPIAEAAESAFNGIGEFFDGAADAAGGFAWLGG